MRNCSKFSRASQMFLKPVPLAYRHSFCAMCIKFLRHLFNLNKKNLAWLMLELVFFKSLKDKFGWNFLPIVPSPKDIKKRFPLNKSDLKIKDILYCLKVLLVLCIKQPAYISDRGCNQTVVGY
jgi:hypothetical protein